jgi:hypothetical protein
VIAFQWKENQIMPPPATIASPAALALKQSCHPALRQLRVEESESAVVITGHVSTYYLKQLAQETIMAHRGKREVVNRVQVVRE